MAIETLAISPAPDTQSINGDLHVIQDKIGGGLTQDAVNLLTGRSEGKARIHWACFFRFETLIPKDSIINGVKLKLWADGVSFQTLTKMQGGWIRPQSQPPKNWQKPNGVGVWAADTDVPLAEWADGASADATVWWNDEPAFLSQAMTTQPLNLGDWSIGDGISAFNAVSGMAAQLQSYLADADNELLRGTGNTPDALPICFQLFEEFIGGSSGGSQGLIASDHLIDTEFVPVLEIDWSPVNFPPVVTILLPISPISTHCLATVDFDATSIDLEDGDISSGIVWNSNLDGVLFTGASFSTSALSVGVHVITAISTDSGSLIGTDITRVRVAKAFVVIEVGGNAVQRLVEAGGNAVRCLTAAAGNATLPTIEAGGNAVRHLTEIGGNATRANTEAGGDVEIGKDC